MVRKNVTFGALALALAISLASCDSNGAGYGLIAGGLPPPGFEDMGLNLQGGVPPGSVLTAVGITSTQFNSIVAAGSGGFAGWEAFTLEESWEPENQLMLLLWTGRSVAQVDAIIAQLTAAGLGYEFERGPAGDWDWDDENGETFTPVTGAYSARGDNLEYVMDYAECSHAGLFHPCGNCGAFYF